MAQLPEEITTVFSLQRLLLAIINEANSTGYTILEQYGETPEAITDFDLLQNTRDQAQTYYSRFSTLLLRNAESYPNASPTMLELLEQSIQSIVEAQAVETASVATIEEAKRDWNLL
ncbi:MAG: hypothetical protein GDA43_18100 [Hormoscilla sp. SP5CHS1]|nr:hypothetical protein [Hormoscilla sp. SP5CHS1]